MPLLIRLCNHGGPICLKPPRISAHFGLLTSKLSACNTPLYLLGTTAEVVLKAQLGTGNGDVSVTRGLAEPRQNLKHLQTFLGER